MAKAWAGRIIGILFGGLAVFVGLSAPYFPGDAAGAMLKGNYQLSWDKTVDKTEDGTSDVTKFRQLLELGYAGFFSPVVANAVIFKVEQEVNSDSPDLVRWQPQIDLGLKGKFWSGTGGAKRLNESSDEPGKNPKTTDNYFVELFYLPPKRVPDLKAKYTLDVEQEEGALDTEKQSITLSSVYTPTKWLSLKGDYNKNQLTDKLKLDADTEDDKIGGSAALKYILSSKLKYDTQYLVELSRSATLKSDGSGDLPGTGKEDTTQTWKNTIAFLPFKNTSIDGSYDYDLKKTKATGEQALTTNAKATVNQLFGEIYAARLEFIRAITEAMGTADDNQKTEDAWTGEFRATLTRQLNFNFKWQEKKTTEDHADPLKNRTAGSENWNVTWIGDFQSFWAMSASWDRTLTYDWIPVIMEEKKVSDDTKYNLKATFAFKAIHLVLEPIYDVTVRESYTYGPSGGLTGTVESDIKDFKFKFAYLLIGTRTIEAKLDHTYGRKTDSLLRNTQRTDNSTGNLVWKAFPGWIFGFDLTRNATDTSGDDIGPDVTTTFGFKADCMADRFAFSSAYKYDKKTPGDDSENFDAKAGWLAQQWDVTLTYNFKKTFSATINEGYAITLTFKYNL